MDARKNDTKKARAAGMAHAKKTVSAAGKGGAATALAVLSAFKRLYPDPRHYLKFENPYQLLVATILSAQCTDEKVNEVTAGLFRRYPRPEDLAGEAVEAIER